jgi:hypothetical protein
MHIHIFLDKLEQQLFPPNRTKSTSSFETAREQRTLVFFFTLAKKVNDFLFFVFVIVMQIIIIIIN